MAENSPKLHACVAVKQGWGYVVHVVDQDGRILKEYTAGDCRADSQVYGTGELLYSTLRKYANQTAHEMLAERGCPDGNVAYDRDILPEDTVSPSPKTEVHVLTVDRVARGKAGGGYLYYPILRLSGRWLEEAGFRYRRRVRVIAQHGRMVITPETQKEG